LRAHFAFGRCAQSGIREIDWLNRLFKNFVFAHTETLREIAARSIEYYFVVECH
jgi:hypothetical protein